MRQVLCPVLVGREQESRLLFDALDGVSAGVGGTFVVVGEAGIGKSRLAREVVTRARSRGQVVLTGRAGRGEVPAAFGPLAEAVLGGLRSREELDLVGLHPFLPALGRLVPQWLPSEPAPGLDSPVILGEGLLRLLRVLAGERGCLLVLEDLHWADPESLAVMDYLADSLAAEPVMCLGTLRTDEAGPGRDAIAAMADRRVARVLDLARLTVEHTIRVARACLDVTALPATVEEVVGDRCDGVPFLVEELLASLIGAGVLVDRDGTWSTTGPIGSVVPSSFAEAVVRRLSGLASPGGRWRPSSGTIPTWPGIGASWPPASLSRLATRRGRLTSW